MSRSLARAARALRPSGPTSRQYLTRGTRSSRPQPTIHMSTDALRSQARKHRVARSREVRYNTFTSCTGQSNVSAEYTADDDTLGDHNHPMNTSTPMYHVSYWTSSSLFMKSQPDLSRATTRTSRPTGTRRCTRTGIGSRPRTRATSPRSLPTRSTSISTSVRRCPRGFGPARTPSSRRARSRRCRMQGIRCPSRSPSPLRKATSWSSPSSRPGSCPCSLHRTRSALRRPRARRRRRRASASASHRVCDDVNVNSSDVPLAGHRHRCTVPSFCKAKRRLLQDKLLSLVVIGTGWLDKAPAEGGELLQRKKSEELPALPQRDRSTSRRLHPQRRRHYESRPYPARSTSRRRCPCLISPCRSRSYQLRRAYWRAVDNSVPADTLLPLAPLLQPRLHFRT
jgi:hypothetical protein